MKTLALIPLIVLCGCTTRTIQIGEARYTSSHLFTAQSVGRVEYKSGTNSLSVEAWNSDVSTQLPIVAGAVAEGVAKGMTK